MTRSAHSRAFEQLAAEHRMAMLEALALGQDTNSYWRLVGVIQGIDDAVKLSKEADTRLSGEDPDAGN